MANSPPLGLELNASSRYAPAVNVPGHPISFHCSELHIPIIYSRIVPAIAEQIKFPAPRPESSMHRYLPTPLSALVVLCSLSLAPSILAQTAQPITSLPKTPGDTRAAAPAPSYTPPAQDDQTNAVHPITSLPKSPQSTATTSAYEPPPAITSTPSTTSEPIAEAATSAPPPATLPPSPNIEPAPAQVFAPPAAPQRLVRPKPIRPFSTAAVAVKLGIAGIGVDVATPLAQHFNLRAGGSFFSYSGNFSSDGINIAGDLKFRSGTASLDWFPFHGGFHISPGITFYNGNNLNATTLVPAGQSFSLGNANYISSTTDPVNGTASVYFGRRTAPSLTIGFGNMIPRSGRHISFPFEIGFQYIGTPTLTFNLKGTACTNANDPTTCSPIQTDAQTQVNIQQQESDIDSDIKPLRFYPIISQGLSIRF